MQIKDRSVVCIYPVQLVFGDVEDDDVWPWNVGICRIIFSRRRHLRQEVFDSYFSLFDSIKTQLSKFKSSWKLSIQTLYRPLTSISQKLHFVRTIHSRLFRFNEKQKTQILKRKFRLGRSNNNNAEWYVKCRGGLDRYGCDSDSLAF